MTSFPCHWSARCPAANLAAAAALACRRAAPAERRAAAVGPSLLGRAPPSSRLINHSRATGCRPSVTDGPSTPLWPLSSAQKWPPLFTLFFTRTFSKSGRLSCDVTTNRTRQQQPSQLRPAEKWPSRPAPRQRLLSSCHHHQPTLLSS